MNKDILKLRQNYPLWMKVQMTKDRIVSFYERNQGQVYLAFSGGKDSTVLLTIARSIYPDIEAVFSDTGLEYPELKEHVKRFKGVTIIRPDISFKQYIDQYGYPICSKQICNTVRYAKKNIAEGKDTLRVRQIRGQEKGSKFNKGKWEFLLDAPFNVSEQCCDLLKKKPLKDFEKRSGKRPILGTLADESTTRESKYLKKGCFDNKNNTLSPMSFWTEQDVLEFIYVNNIPIASVYGDIKKGDDYKTTGVNRTGCIFCGMGVHLEKGENRFQQLKKSHPHLHKYCMDDLGMREVLNYIGVESE